MVWVPAHRLLHVVEKHPNPIRALNGRAAQRLLRELRSGRQAFVSLRAADGLLAHLDLVHWWHLPAEQGGLADIYEDGAEYGKPAKGGTGARPRRRRTREKPAIQVIAPSRRRYATEEERLAARRKTYRDYYRRTRERQAAA